jgi:hypothetical protein
VAPIFVPGEQARSEIVVETRLGTRLRNSQTLDTTAPDHHLNEAQRRAHPGARFLTKPSGYYNCHGLTLAARRTRIYEDADVRTALREDGYREIPADAVQAGDLIVYLSEDGAIEHSGLVVQAEPLLMSNPDGPKSPMVWSKWGSGSEVLHRWSDCDYTKAFVKYYRIVP